MGQTCYYDPFNRANAGTLGPDWPFGATNFSISANWASPNIPASWRLGIWHQPVASSSYFCEAYVRIPAAAPGLIGVLLGAEDPADPTHNLGAPNWRNCFRGYFGWDGIPQKVLVIASAVGAVIGSCAYPGPELEGTLRLEIEPRFVTARTLRLYFNNTLYVTAFSVAGAVWTGLYGGIQANYTVAKPTIDWWRMCWGRKEDSPVYLTTDDSGEIYPTVTNNVDGIAGVSEDGDGVIHVEAPRVATDLGDGVLLVE